MYVLELLPDAFLLVCLRLMFDTDDLLKYIFVYNCCFIIIVSHLLMWCSMGGKQVFEVPPTSVGGSHSCLAVCVRGVDAQKVGN